MPTPRTPSSTTLALRETRGVQFDNAPWIETPAGKAWAAEEFPPEKTTSLDQMKLMDAKFKVKTNVDKTWTAAVPMFAGKYGDIKALASFNSSIKDALRREELFEDCIKVGIPLSELLHRLLVLRLEPSSVVMTHL